MTEFKFPAKSAKRIAVVSARPTMSTKSALKKKNRASFAEEHSKQQEAENIENLDVAAGEKKLKKKKAGSTTDVLTEVSENVSMANNQEKKEKVY